MVLIYCNHRRIQGTYIVKTNWSEEYISHQRSQFLIKTRSCLEPVKATLLQGQEPEGDSACAETGVNQRTLWWRGWAFILGCPTTTTRRHCASAGGRSVWKWTKFYYERNRWCNLMNMYILIYINCTKKVWGTHVRWNYPPCIRRRNKECLPFNTTLVLRGFIPGFSMTKSSPRRKGLALCKGEQRGPEGFRLTCCRDQRGEAILWSCQASSVITSPGARDTSSPCDSSSRDLGEHRHPKWERWGGHPLALPFCHGLTWAGNQAPHSLSLSPPQWVGGENQMSKSEKTHGLR